MRLSAVFDKIKKKTVNIISTVDLCFLVDKMQSTRCYWNSSRRDYRSLFKLDQETRWLDVIFLAICPDFDVLMTRGFREKFCSSMMNTRFVSWILSWRSSELARSSRFCFVTSLITCVETRRNTVRRIFFVPIRRTDLVMQKAGYLYYGIWGSHQKSGLPYLPDRIFRLSRHQCACVASRGKSWPTLLDSAVVMAAVRTCCHYCASF